ncbi:MAG: MOSC domain-containing protein [Candidatus Krumholzibacteriota bacterium]|nr:MOSC domain-containing protein [Candidatus Krumholzibacteriota bacterium]
MKRFKIVSLNVSGKPGRSKRPVPKVVVKKNHGIVGDAHAGDWHRQISLLAEEDIEYMRNKLDSLGPGDFAENITTRGIDLPSLPLGAILQIGEVKLEVTQIGKECHKGCEILKRAGECIMPGRGIFARVLEGGEITGESEGTYHI